MWGGASRAAPWILGTSARTSPRASQAHNQHAQIVTRALGERRLQDVLADLMQRPLGLLQHQLLGLVIADDVPDAVRRHDHETVGSADPVHDAMRLSRHAAVAALEAVVSERSRDGERAADPIAHHMAACSLHPPHLVWISSDMVD